MCNSNERVLKDYLKDALALWSLNHGGLMTASELERAVKAATQAVHDCGPNRYTACTPEGAYYKWATGPLRS